MFTALTERLSGVLQRLVGRGVLSEQDVTEALPADDKRLKHVEAIIFLQRM